MRISLWAAVSPEPVLQSVTAVKVGKGWILLCAASRDNGWRIHA